MKKYVIGNWKCHKDEDEARIWLTEFAGRYRPTPGLEIILAPSFLCLPGLARLVRELGLAGFSLAAQDISPYPKGSYTGAVAADMVKGMADFVIIGHAERRNYFHETSQDVANKAREAVDTGLTPIICVDQPYAVSQLQAISDIDSKEMIIAYGPVDATMTRSPEPPARAAETARSILRIRPGLPVVYGGSLDPAHVKEYLLIPELAGIFVGEASLDVHSFLAICEQAARWSH